MIFTGFFLILCGLILGSFISALSYRYPKNISIARGRSFCPNCKKTIRWFDNIPLISYAFLKGRCRNCKKPISVRYPVIEAATALGFLFIGLKFYPDPLSVIYYLTVFCLLVLIFVIDFEHRFIPDDFVFLGILLFIVYSLIVGSNSLFPDIFAGFFSALLLISIHLLTRGHGMGLGDVKFAVFGGMITGVNLFLVWLFVSFLTGGATGIILILAKKAGLKDKIAFGPFLVVGLIVTVLYGNVLLRFVGF